jgi:hypothetical protein
MPRPISMSARTDSLFHRDDKQGNTLRPIWLTKAETASRVRQRMHVVMQWAWAQGYISASPVAVVDHLLPKQNAKVQHQPAMPWRDIAAAFFP